MRRSVALLGLTACGGAAAAAPFSQSSPIPVQPLGPLALVTPPRTTPEASTSVPVSPLAMVDGCPDDMVAVDAYCIDRYEAPNRRGELRSRS